MNQEHFEVTAMFGPPTCLRAPIKTPHFSKPQIISKCFQWGLSTKPSKPINPMCMIYATKAMTGSKPTKVSSFHFRDLTEAFAMDAKIHRDEWEGLGHVTHIEKGKHGVSVAADKSCHSLVDAKRIITGNFADVINIKLAKVGVVGGLEIIEAARTSGLDMMIAAGFGCFKWLADIFLSRFCLVRTL
uniref:Enolase C-terminal domain-containing protein n=1 Tax=Salix viminalis TaxID=40686 RepID=A0A6N2L8P0_SALVM